MLAIHYLPHDKISRMARSDRIDTILSLVRTDRIIIIDGRLESRDEASLIRATMDNVDEGFRGIELGVLYDNGRKSIISRMKHTLADTIAGRSRGLTIIGPASIISEMRQYPEDIIINFGDEYIRRHARNLIAKPKVNRESMAKKKSKDR